MKILLINNNPVVSRLTALSARKEDIEIDEIQEVTELSTDKYDIVFVDADSWSKDVQDVISENITAQKRVLFYSQDDNGGKEAFDITILKPFLPSEVSTVIRNLEETQGLEEEKSPIEEERHFDLLSESKKDEKREDLFELDETVEKVAELNPMEKETVEDKSDLVDELDKIDLELEDVVSTDSFDKKLDEAFPLVSDDLEDDLFKEGKNETKEENLKIESSDFASMDDDLFDIDASDTLSLEGKKPEETKLEEKISSDDVLDFDFEQDEEVDLTTVDASKDTKILNKEEVENIKEILHGEKEETLELDDLMVPTIPVMALSEEDVIVEKKKKSKKEKIAKVNKEKTEMEIGSGEVIQTLASLPIESLRELLAGARVNINIKFPKAK